MRPIALASTTANLIAMYLAAVTGDTPILLITWLGAAAGVVGYLHARQEARHRGESLSGCLSLALQLGWEMRASGLRPGEKLMSTGALARRHNTTRPAVRRALGVLHGEGLVDDDYRAVRRTPV